jgi:HEAT repeat protein
MSRAIGLLGTFKSAESVNGLAQITEAKKPLYRCLAIQSLAEIASKETLPVLIKKLDDRAVCMKTTSTDPARDNSVFVSDEAVRALETITGQAFGNVDSLGHRPSKPWKEWWTKQEKLQSRAPKSTNLRLESQWP